MPRELRIFNIDDVRALSPCYDPNTYLLEDWRGAVVDMLRMGSVPAADRLWVVSQLVSERTARLFAVYCAREALSLQPNPDPRSTAACDVAERFARGEATEAELSAARNAAWGAVETATAARNAAWAAAETAATAARSAAWDAAWAAEAERIAAVAAEAATRSAASAARSAARSAAVAEEKEARETQLIEFIRIIEQEGD